MSPRIRRPWSKSRMARYCLTALAPLVAARVASGQLLNTTALGSSPTPVVKTLPAPGVTGWKPPDRVTPAAARPAILGARTGYRTLHSDTVNSDEVDLVFPPTFARDWSVEPHLYLPEGPTFDRAGHLYMTPTLPPESVWLLSLDGETGARRFVIPDPPLGAGGSPLVLEDPERDGGQIIYAGSYDELVAVRDSGDVVWRAPTGLPTIDLSDCSEDPEVIQQKVASAHMYGVNYHPQTDTVVGVTGSGYLVFLDRSSGALRGTYRLPSEAAAAKAPSWVPDAAWARMNQLLAPMMEVPCGLGPAEFIVNAALGGGTPVANYFSIDPNSGRIWITSTDPADAEKGALYRIEVGLSAGQLVVSETSNVPCVVMNGGSASTPALRSDGQRVYLADAKPDGGSVIYAIDAETCTVASSTQTSSQVVASLAVTLDGEIYAMTLDALEKLEDLGTEGLTTPTRFPVESTYTLNRLQTAAPMQGPVVTQNGIAVQVGAGYPFGPDYDAIVTTAIALFDRATGEPRYVASGGEESIATSPVGPGGTMYLPHSPLRRVIALALAPNAAIEPLVGGVSRWQPLRHDLLVRDAACAAADRLAHLQAHQSEASPGFISRSEEMAAQLLNQALGAVEPAQQVAELSGAEADAARANLMQASAALAAEDYADAAAQARETCAALSTT